MDIFGEHDINKLKVMAYDQLALLQQIQRNLDIINARIAELQQAQAPSTSAPKQPINVSTPKANSDSFTGRSHY